MTSKNKEITLLNCLFISIYMQDERFVSQHIETMFSIQPHTLIFSRII